MSKNSLAFLDSETEDESEAVDKKPENENHELRVLVREQAQRIVDQAKFILRLQQDIADLADENHRLRNQNDELEDTVYTQIEDNARQDELERELETMGLTDSEAHQA